MAEPALSGMTTSERLFALGMLESFDAARSAGDLAAMRRMLETARVDPPSIELILSRQPDA